MGPNRAGWGGGGGQSTNSRGIRRCTRAVVLVKLRMEGGLVPESKRSTRVWCCWSYAVVKLMVQGVQEARLHRQSIDRKVERS